MSKFDVKAIDWSKGDGLVPAIVQDKTSARVLMLGYMNEEALQETMESGFVTFYSRSRQKLWKKGETSGNTLSLRDLRYDCDCDALLVVAKAAGPTCHTGSISCFGDDALTGLTFLADLEKLICSRRDHPQKGSYTCQLFEEGLPRMAQKVGEEGVEVALAGALKADNLKEEASDLLYHLLVLLAASDTSLAEVLSVLQERRK